MPRIKIIKKELPKALAGMGVLAPTTTTTTMNPTVGLLNQDQELTGLQPIGFNWSMPQPMQVSEQPKQTLQSPLDKKNPFDRLSIMGGYKPIQAPKAGVSLSEPGISYQNVANGPQGGVGITNVNLKNFSKAVQPQPAPTRMQKAITGLNKFSTGLGKFNQAMDIGITGLGVVANYFDNRKKQRYFDKWMRESMLPHNYYAVDTTTDRGDYDINEGMFRPNLMGYKSKGTQANPIGAMTSFAKYGGLVKADKGMIVPGDQLVQQAFLPDVSLNFAIPPSVSVPYKAPESQQNAYTNFPNLSKGDIRDIIAQKESGGDYRALPRKKDGTLASSAVGKYQFLWNQNKQWISQVTGVTTKEDFRNNPQAQEEAFTYWDKNILTPNAKKIKTELGVRLPLNNIKYAIHFAGPSGAYKYFSTGKETTDAFGSNIAKYAGIKTSEQGGETTNNSNMKIRIVGGPKQMRAGGQSDTDMDPKYSGQSDYGLYIGQRNLYNTMAKNQYSDAGNTVSEKKETSEDPHVLEAEGGETILRPDGTHMDISGDRHTNGGVKLTESQAPKGSFIYSDTKKMKIKDAELLAHFGKTAKSGGITPAELAKQYDVNKYLGLLQDPNTDNLTKQTAKLMIENYQTKLAELALVQEGMKGFPQGIPEVAQSVVAAAMGPMQQGQTASMEEQEAKYGGSMGKYAAGGTSVKPKYPWLKFLTEYEKQRGKAGMQPHPNFGINTDEEGNPVVLDENGRPINKPVYIAKGQEDAMDYYAKTYIPNKMPWLDEIPEPLQEAAATFGINHAQDPRIPLMQAAGVIDDRSEFYKDKKNLTDKIDQLWNEQGRAAVNQYFNENPQNFLGAFSQTLTSPTEIDQTGMKGVYANTNAGSNLPGWTDRVNQTNQDILARYYNQGVSPMLRTSPDATLISENTPAWLKPWTESYTKEGRTSPTGQPTVFDTSDPNKFYRDYDFWKSVNNNKDFNSPKELQDFVYNYVNKKDPAAIQKMWERWGTTAKGKKLPKDKQFSLEAFSDAPSKNASYLGARFAELMGWKPPVTEQTTQAVTETTTIAPGAPAVTTEPTLVNALTVPDIKGFKSRRGRAAWTRQDINNALNAAMDLASIKKYHPYAPTVQPVLPEFIPVDWRGYASALQSGAAKAADQMATYQPGQSLASNLSFLQGQQAGQLGEYIGKTDQWNAAGAAQMDAQRADTLNKFAMANAQNRAKAYEDENILDSMYRSAMRTGRKGLTKAINQGYTNAANLYNLNQVESPYFTIDPYTGLRRFNSDNDKAAYMAILAGQPDDGTTQRQIFEKLYGSSFESLPTKDKIDLVKSWMGDKTTSTKSTTEDDFRKAIKAIQANQSLDDDETTTKTTATGKYGGSIGASYVKSVSDWYNKLAYIQDPNERQRLAEAYARKMHFGK